MADSIDDLFDCFDETTDENGGKRNDAAAEVSESVSGIHSKGVKRENSENDEYNSKRSKADEEEVQVDDINFEELKNRIVVHTIETIDSCTHEVACPPGQAYTPLQPARGEPVKKYAFTLDPFQKESILCVDNNQSVLVSAHTSAGKTVIAELRPNHKFIQMYFNETRGF